MIHHILIGNFQPSWRFFSSPKLEKLNISAIYHRNFFGESYYGICEIQPPGKSREHHRREVRQKRSSYTKLHKMTRILQKNLKWSKTTGKTSFLVNFSNNAKKMCSFRLCDFNFNSFQFSQKFARYISTFPFILFFT